MKHEKKKEKKKKRKKKEAGLRTAYIGCCCITALYSWIILFILLEQREIQTS